MRKDGHASVGSRRLYPPPHPPLTLGHIYISNQRLATQRWRQSCFSYSTLAGARPSQLMQRKGRLPVANKRMRMTTGMNINSSDVAKNGDPVYENLEPWANPNDTGCDDDYDANTFAQEYMALCYKNIHLWIVQNPTHKGRSLLATEVTLAYHKGADRKPKLYVSICISNPTNMTPTRPPSSSTKRLFQCSVL